MIKIMKMMMNSKAAKKSIMKREKERESCNKKRIWSKVQILLSIIRYLIFFVVVVEK